MNHEEIQSLIKQLKGAGLTDEQIMDTFYETFESGEMDRKDLEALAEAMGYELTDDFKSEEAKDPIEEKESGLGKGEVSKEALEDAKEIEPGESKEEFKEKIEDIKEDGGEKLEEESKEEEKSEPASDESEEKPEEKEEIKEEEKSEEVSEKEDEGESEDEEWDKAQKMFGI